MAGESASAERPGALASSADPAPEAAAAPAGPASAPRPPAPGGSATAAEAAAAAPPAAGAAAGLTAALGRFGVRPDPQGRAAADTAHRPGRPTMALAAIAGLMLVAAPFGFSDAGMRLVGAAGTGSAPADASGGSAGAQAPVAEGGPVVPGDGGAAGGQDPGGFVPDVLPQAPGAVGEDRDGDGGGGESGGGGGADGSGPVGEAPAQALVDGAQGDGEDDEGDEDGAGGDGGNGEKDGEKSSGDRDDRSGGGEKDAEAAPEKGGAEGEDGAGGSGEGSGKAPGSGEGGDGDGAEGSERSGEKGAEDGPGGDGGSGGGALEDAGAPAAQEGSPYSTHLDASPGSRDVDDERNYVAVAGPGCSDEGASYAVHGGGIERTGSSGYTDLGCDDAYDAVPVSGDPNGYTETATTWTFTPGTTDATCALRILVVNGDHPLWESGEPAHFELFNGDRAGGENRGVYKIGRPEGGNYWAVTEFGDVNRSFTLRLTNTGSAGKLPASVVEAECW
ncbi:hypothetical protein [Nocardiopsis composta]|uniref:Uncharacterized protein n=2 Tax=Nocardiopsis composta TaxID=157465 RepID=A0A7W8QPL8_9ACTN|nr:hypothetical protein [Nocardiopsis composta]MBB5434161.1 hypothetical protein [Nocardiopsis composta]